jgi:type I restriction enzyme S subunit
MSGAFLDLVLRSRYGHECLKRVQTGALLPHLNCTWVREIFVPVPPIGEQYRILDDANSRTAGVDRAISTAESEIMLLREYRTRLIADVVTGKCDVRDAAARLPREAQELEPLDETEAEGDADEVNAADTDEVLEEPDA